MSALSSASDNANDTSRIESLKVWNCINCRRRKVRCDRRHPCAPCTRNKIECVFPVSGRIPRRGPNPSTQKQAELVGRLRRLEALVGDLGSQVENAAVAPQKSQLVESSMSATSATSSETVWPDNGPALHSQSVSEDPETTHDEMSIHFGMKKDNRQMQHVFEESEELLVTSSGELVVKDGFWTVFCKEVCFSSSNSYRMLSTVVEQTNMGLTLKCASLAEMYTRWNRSLKPYTGP